MLRCTGARIGQVVNNRASLHHFFVPPPLNLLAKNTVKVVDRLSYLTQWYSYSPSILAWCG